MSIRIAASTGWLSARAAIWDATSSASDFAAACFAPRYSANFSASSAATARYGADAGIESRRSTRRGDSGIMQFYSKSQRDTAEQAAGGAAVRLDLRAQRGIG